MTTINGVDYTVITGPGPFELLDWNGAGSPTNFMISGFSSVVNNAFQSNTNITNVHIGNTVTSIGEDAFRDTSNLISVSFESNSQLTSIGINAFFEATSLTSIAIPDTVTSIGVTAFYGATSLTSVSFGENSQLTTIGTQVFKFATSLTSIAIPDTVTSIGSNAFYGATSLTSVTFGENSQLTTIGRYAFYEAASLTTIAIPDTVTTIGVSAFSGTTSLTTVSLTEDLTIDGTTYSIGTTGDFFGAVDVSFVPSTITINLVVYKIIYGTGPFELLNWTAFGSPANFMISGFSSLANTALQFQTTITNVHIGNTVTSIGTRAFYQATSLASITFEDNSELTSIGADAFYHAISLASITFEDNSLLTTIGADAFRQATSLASITFGAGSLLNSIGAQAFFNATSLASIAIPDGVTSIGYRTFYQASSLASIAIPDGVTSIGQEAFYHTSLASIVIPDTVITIGVSAFSQATSLTSVTFGTGSQLTNIGNSAFYLASSLASIAIPDGVTSIGENVFSGSSLASITFGTESLLNSIGVKAFYQATSLASIAIPDSVTTIGAEAFYHAISLASIAIPDGVTSIGYRTFREASSLASITFGDNSLLTSIGEDAFFEATSLESITIPITNTAFNNIGTNAFSYSNLTNFYANTTVLNNLTLTVGPDETIGGKEGVYVYDSTDTTGPTMSITSTSTVNLSKTNDPSIDLIFTSNERTTNFNVNSIDVENGSLSIFNGSGPVYTATFTPTADGVCTIKVPIDKFTDANLNNNSASNIFTWTHDATIPIINDIAFSWGAVLNKTNDSAETADTVTVITEGVEDGQAVFIELNGSIYTANVSNNNATVTITAGVLQDLSSGSYAMTANVSDAVGNAATTVTSSSFLVDTSPPILSVVTAITAHSSVTTPSFTFTSSEEGIITSTLAFTTQNTAVIGDNTIIFDSLVDGTYTDETVTVTDPANNATVLTIPEFIIDIEAPIITLNGNYVTIVDLMTPYIELGATAVDNVDVTILTSDIVMDSTTIDTSYIGEYIITYAVADSVGNVGTANRIVRVVIPFPSTIVNICFPAGTPVTTDQGQVAIEKLNPDKHTIRGKEIVAITQSRPLQKHIVCFEKDALSKNVPSQQTLCSKNHAIFYKGEMTKARNLVDMCENVTLVDYNGETLYNVLLKKHDKMMVNNLICETLHPQNIAAKISTMKDGTKKNKTIQELTKIIKENNIPEYQKMYASLK